MDNNETIYKDFYLKLIVNLIIKTEWYELYKMNVEESLQLDYNTYIYMKDLLNEYEKSSKKEKDKISNQLNSIKRSIDKSIYK